jgi:hypothetical protein
MTMWLATTQLAGERGRLLMISTYPAPAGSIDTPADNCSSAGTMTFSFPFRLPSRNARVLCAAFLTLAAVAIIFRAHPKPRPWKVDEVPVAFWAWRNEAPSQTDVREAIETAKARTLFLRAGQIDYQDGKLRRIRPVTGPLPAAIDLHLVYNATPSTLTHLESIDEKTLAGSIARAFREDVDRAAQDHAQVLGLQIDFDVPTRLLRRYERILRELRADLNPGVRLSITGLPTWMQSPELSSALAQVDFWVPQFYGASIPERVGQLIPISNVKETERFVNSARELKKPFYAGLAAYSWALLYDASGALISLRGDMDPSAIASDTNLELIDQRLFNPAAKAGSDWRYAYRARADGVTDNLAMHAGDVLVLDVPSAASLRQSTQIVRELAGEMLLGICVFRLPARDDPATLTAAQVAAALADETTAPDFKISFKRNEEQPNAWLLEVANHGNAGAIDLKIDVPVDSGTIEFLTAQRGAALEAICHSYDSRNGFAYQPCAQNRANLIRLVAPALRTGQNLKAMLVFKTPLTHVVPVWLDTQTDAGQLYQDRLEIVVDGGVKR